MNSSQSTLFEVPKNIVVIFFTVLALVTAFSAHSQATSKMDAPAKGPQKERTPPKRNGLHFFFDASASMCGYLRGNDSSKLFLTLIKHAGALRDDEKNNRVMLIRQHSTKAGPGDISEAPANFQALVDSPVVEAKRQCLPFDGIDSNLDSIFLPSAGGNSPRSFVLVSDMQLDERALTTFIDRFRSWLREQSTDEPLSVGLITFGVPFSGRYFPVSEPDPNKRRQGYTLPTHPRPLSMLWFLVSGEHFAAVRELLVAAGISGVTRPSTLLYGLQLLPVATEDSSRWLQTLPALNSAEALLGRPTHQAIAPTTKRSQFHLRDCVERHDFTGDVVTVRLSKMCKDGKPFFDGTVNAVELTLPIDVRLGFAVTAPGDSIARVANDKLLLRLTRNAPASIDVPLGVAPMPAALNAAILSELSLDNDACRMFSPSAIPASEAKASWEDECVLKIKGKSYRYDTLVQQFSARARSVLDERYATKRLDLKVIFDADRKR